MSEDEYKQQEITFKFYLPDNSSEYWMHVQASDMFHTIHEIDQMCRSLIKYDDKTIKDQYDLAEKIRDLIHSSVDMDKIP
jgi:hypothetical protein